MDDKQFRKEAEAIIDLFINYDQDHDCVFCAKTEWGKEKHKRGCPYKAAYDLKAKLESEKANVRT
jgi:hypothetical protein